MPMAKRAFIIHGWGGFPEKGWFPWLKRSLEENGFSVTVPSMPNAAHPLKEEWMPVLRELIGQPDVDTYLIGHSLGCQAILHYLQSLPTDAIIGGVVLVAPVSGEESITNRINEVEEGWEVLGPWIKMPMDWNAIRVHARSITGIFSDNDRWIRPEMASVFQEKLGAKTMMLHEKFHFSESDGFSDLPEALNAVLKNNHE